MNVEIQNIDFGIYARYANGQVMAIYEREFNPKQKGSVPYIAYVV
jgi:hypothetical protein